MRRPQGYSRIVGPGLSGLSDPGLAQLHREGECDTFTCGHCQRVVHVPSKARPEDIGGQCGVCMRLVCAVCAGVPACRPFQERMERDFRHAELRRWLAG